MLNIFVCGWQLQPILVSPFHKGGISPAGSDEDKPPSRNFLAHFCLGLKKIEAGLTHVMHLIKSYPKEIALGILVLTITSPLIVAAFACSFVLLAAAISLVVLGYIFTGIPFGVFGLALELSKQSKSS